ncbi:MAG: amidohydrolase family protein [Pirellulales bacterium]
MQQTGQTRRRFVHLLGWLVVFAAASFTVELSATEFPGREWTRLDSAADAGWSVERLAAARELSRTLDTAAVVVVQEGRIVDQWGAVALPLNCHSVRKSILSALYGRHVVAGNFRREATLDELGIDDNAPALTEIERTARVVDLLKARSGIYHPALYETPAMKARRPQRGSHAPDTFWYYNNWDFNALGTIFEQAVEHSLFEEFEKQLARPIAMQDFVRQRHASYVRGDDSIHPAYPFELSTRDLARFGLLMLEQGHWQGEQLVPAEWVAESTQSYSDVGASGGYGYMWWVAVDGKHFPGVTLPPGSYSARGNRGQYLVVIPAWQVVVAHRVNTFQEKTSVDASQFGQLLNLILAARPADDVGLASVEEPGARQVPEPADRADAATEYEFDLLLRGGQVIDGTGAKPFAADVAVRDGRVVAVGQLAERSARRVIDVADRIVAPGFIDLHSHAEGGLVADDPLRRAAPNLVTQGITTVVVNQDGGGPQSIAEQRDAMNKRGVGINVAQLIGHGQLRRAALGSDFRNAATDEQIQRMCQQIRTGMDEGAFGLSAGLEYVPGRWSTPAEMQALVGELARYDGVYVVHERSSGSRPMWYLPSRDDAALPSMIDNLREQIEIAEATGVTVVATHIKARGVDFWGSSRLMIDLIERARSRGVPIYADQYAYNTSGSDGRVTLVPDWIESEVHAGEGRSNDGATAGDATDSESSPDLDESKAEKPLERALADEKLAGDLRRDVEYEIVRRGGPENILIVEHPQADYVGKSLAELSELEKCDPVEMAIRLQSRDHARLRAFSMSEEDVEQFAATPWTATSTDAGIALPHDRPVHPRFYGAFPRKIRHYALDRGLISLEEAIRVSTSLPASILGLDNRGTVAVGAHADLVVFDPERIGDRADAFKPHQYCVGIEYVFLAGQAVVEREECLGNLVGTVLRRGTADNVAEPASGN